MQPVQNITVDDRVSRTQYQYTLEDPDVNELHEWTNKFVSNMKTDAGTGRRGDRPADRWARGLARLSTASPLPVWASRPQRSTMRFTTPLANARSAQCTRSSTSTTSFWKRCLRFKLARTNCNPSFCNRTLPQMPPGRAPLLRFRVFEFRLGGIERDDPIRAVHADSADSQCWRRCKLPSPRRRSATNLSSSSQIRQCRSTEHLHAHAT